jgi:MoxR-like ATPase
MAYEQVQALKARMQESIIGQEDVVERLIIGLLANGNLLVEGLPGLAKTRAIKALANNLEADFSRIQFTPDLLPSDVTGTEVYYQADGKGEFRFEAGPIFANIVLGDEINRAPAKVQAAMLEAMEERQVTVAGTTHKMPPTYPLPEAQMDRFLMHVNIEYPPVEDEVLIIDLVRREESAANAERNSQPPQEQQRISQDAIFAAREEIAKVKVSAPLQRYMADLVYATRTPEKYSEDLARWIDVGGSPRASLALDKCSRTHAWLNQRDYVDPEDIRSIVHDCLRHRLMLSYEAQGEGVRADQVIDALVEQVALP